MLFSEEDAPLLKAWIVKRIENTSDADADVLAEYVIALLKHDGDEESVRSLCEKEIPDFLTEDSKQFLDDVFQAITYRSYMPGAPPPPPKKQIPTGPSRPMNTSPDSSRKRRFDETAGSDDVERQGPNGRVMKQARRGRRGRDDRIGHAQDQMHVQQYPMGMMMPSFDPNNPMETFMRMQAMGMPFPGMGDGPAWFGGARGGRGGGQRRKRCRDFDTKGYCSRGGTCPHDHGESSQEEYDPVNAMMLSFPPSDMDMDMDTGRGRGRKGRQRGGRKGGARAPFSADGPVNDQSKTAIVVENIPEDHFSEEQVRDFFSQFGDIVEVSMKPYKHLAIVRYDKWSSANNAYQSPKVIFDNRFVKVFWYKDEKENIPASIQNGSGFKKDTGPDEMDVEPEMDMEEFQRKQEEAQKLYQEREDKRTEIQKQKEQLDKQQQELLAKHQAESERLQAKLAEKNGAGAVGSSSSADVLRAKLAALEQEAKMLGLDPEAEQNGEYPRGGYRGRGRGGYRARGFAPRGRGSFRGQAGRHAAYAQFSIDNRPRKVAVSGVDFTASEKDEALRHFLLNLGEFESVETSPSVTKVSFRDRKSAEKFYFSLHGKELPGVEGKLDLSWVNTALPPVTVKNAQEGDAGVAGDAMAGMDEEREEGEREENAVNMDYEGGEYGWEG